MRDIASDFSISVSTAHDIMTNELGFERISARWVPRLLSIDEKQRQVEASGAFLRRWRREGDRFLNRTITTDIT